MPEDFPPFVYAALPDDPEILDGMRRACLAATAVGLYLVPTETGEVRMGPKDLMHRFPALVAAMRVYKPYLERFVAVVRDRILAEHPGVTLLLDTLGPEESWMICASCLQHVKAYHGHILQHRARNQQPCLPLPATQEQRVATAVGSGGNVHAEHQRLKAPAEIGQRQLTLNNGGLSS